MSNLDGVRRFSSMERVNPLGDVIGRGAQSLRQEYRTVVDGFDNNPHFDSRDSDQVDAVRDMLSEATLKRLSRRPDSIKLPRSVVLPEDGVAIASDAVAVWGIRGRIERPDSVAGLTTWQDRRIDWALEAALQRDQIWLRGGDHKVVADYGYLALDTVLRESTRIRERFGEGVSIGELDSTRALWTPSRATTEVRKRPGLVKIEDFTSGVMGALGEFAPARLPFPDRKRLDQVGQRTVRLWTSPDAGRRAEEFRLEAPKSDLKARGITEIDALSVLHESRTTGPVPEGTMGYVQEAVSAACVANGIDYAYHNSLLVRQQASYAPPVR